MLKAKTFQQQQVTRDAEADLNKQKSILIAGNSLISNIDQQTLSHRYNMRVRSYLGATTDDMLD